MTSHPGRWHSSRICFAMWWLDHELPYDTASTAVVIDVSVFYMGRKNCSLFPE